MRPSRPSIPPSRRERRRSLEPKPPPLSPTRDRARRLFVGSLTLLAGAGLGWLASDVVDDDRFREMAQIAQALMEEEDGAAWPPRQHEGRLVDAGTPPSPDTGPAPDLDAGPPLPTPPPERPGFRVRQEQRDGLYLLEAVIGDASFEDPLPMVVVLHGRGDRAHVPGGPFMDLAHPVRVIVPQAPDSLGDGWQWLPVRVGDGLVDRLSSTLFETADRLARFILGLLDDRQTVGRAIVTGFSQGGLLTLTLAVHHDDVVGHAIPLAAWLPPPLEPSYLRRDRRFAPIRSMHGTADPIVPIDPTTALFGRLSEIGFTVELVQVPGVEHTMNREMNLLFHEWLDEAVCEMVGDTLGAAAARRRAAELRALPAPPLPDASSAPDGALLDGAVAPSPQRAEPRDAAAGRVDAGPPPLPAAPAPVPLEM